MDSGIGVPLFPDSTRYAINYEDNYSNDLIVEKNYIYSHFNGLLLGVYHAKVEGNLFFGTSGVVVYNNHVCVIKDNVFMESPGISLQSSSSSVDRTIYFHNNTVEYAGHFMLNSTNRTTVMISNNRLNIAAASVTGNIEMIDNCIMNLADHVGYTQVTFSGKKIVGNTFEGFGVGNGYGKRFFLGKMDGSDGVIRNNVFRNIDFAGSTIANEVEYFDSEFYNCIIQCKTSDKTKDSFIKLTNCYLKIRKFATAAHLSTIPQVLAYASKRTYPNAKSPLRNRSAAEFSVVLWKTMSRILPSAGITNFTSTVLRSICKPN